MGRFLIVKNADFSQNALMNVPIGVKTYILSADYINGCTSQSSTWSSNWCSGILAKQLDARGGKLTIKAIYVKLSSPTTLTLKEYTFPQDKSVVPTLTGNTMQIVVTSDMLDTTKGVANYYKVPVNIELNNTIVTFGSVYLDTTRFAPEGDYESAGYWSMIKSFNEWSAGTDGIKPTSIGYDIE